MQVAHTHTHTHTSRAAGGYKASGSAYPRTELRHTLPSGSLAAFNISDRTTLRTLTVRGAVQQFTPAVPEVVIAQVRGADSAPPAIWFSKSSLASGRCRELRRLSRTSHRAPLPLISSLRRQAPLRQAATTALPRLGKTPRSCPPPLVRVPCAPQLRSVAGQQPSVPLLVKVVANATGLARPTNANNRVIVSEIAAFLPSPGLSPCRRPGPTARRLPARAASAAQVNYQGGRGGTLTSTYRLGDPYTLRISAGDNVIKVGARVKGPAALRKPPERAAHPGRAARAAARLARRSSGAA